MTFKSGTCCEAFPALVLAAGASRRMGRPKALLNLGDGTMLDRAIQQARLLSEHVTVLTGAGYPLIRYRAHRQPNAWRYADGWQAGQSASLQSGIQSLGPQAKGVFVVLLDQPLIEAADMRHLAARARLEPGQAVAADFQGRPGAPAFIPRRLWPELMALEGDRGAMSVLQAYGAETLPIPGALRDVDTVKDWLGVSENYRRRFL